MTVRSGGKVCWGSGGGAPPVIPDQVEFDPFTPAAVFTPLETNGAPLVWDVLASGFVGKVIKHAPAVISEASAFHCYRIPEILAILNPAATVEVQTYSDNADTGNNISMSLGYRGGTSPVNSVSGAPTYQTLAVASQGAYNITRFTFQINSTKPTGAFMYEVVNWHVRRNVDAHPGNVYLIGLLVYFERQLA
jgi:hypothetical protein